MIRPSDIHSVSTFTRNAKKLIQQVKETQNPIAITVNGHAEVIVIDAKEYEALTSKIQKSGIVAELDTVYAQYAQGKFVTVDELEKEVDEILGL